MKPFNAAFLALALLAAPASGQNRASDGFSIHRVAADSIPRDVMRQILRAEDLRIWDSTVSPLLANPNARVRERAALAAGRIGDDKALPVLLSLLATDPDAMVRAMAAFGLGEIESPAAAAGLQAIAANEGEPGELRARAVEALGKIAAALDAAGNARRGPIGNAVLRILEAESVRQSGSNRSLVYLALTAALRSKQAGAGPVIAKYLNSSDAGIRAAAANTLARLKGTDGLDRARALASADPDPIVRANAVRMLGAAPDTGAYDVLSTLVAGDTDSRVRVSAIRALASLKDARGAAPLLQRAEVLMPRPADSRAPFATPGSGNWESEVLEIATALGQLLPSTSHAGALAAVRWWQTSPKPAPEIEMAFARIAPTAYLQNPYFSRPQVMDGTSPAIAAPVKAPASDWHRIAAVAAGLGEIAAAPATPAGGAGANPVADALVHLRRWLDDPALPSQAAAEVLTAFAALKPTDLDVELRRKLQDKDPIVRATAAGLLGEIAPSEENAKALAAALPAATRDPSNDAALAIVDALVSQKTLAANEALKAALNSPDFHTRKRAIAALKTAGAGDFQEKLGVVVSRNQATDYDRVLIRLDYVVRAVVATDKGTFVLELLPEAAPLAVDNFVQLARRGYYNGLSFHRVVPNFVIQGGDPRGDGNGGPGYDIRCEINQVPFERGVLGMALSGKDTGGSQWFITHSPQPHLDGGYTVFGRVAEGMDVVDRIARGDLIRSIVIEELPARI